MLLCSKACPVMITHELETQMDVDVTPHDILYAANLPVSFVAVCRRTWLITLTRGYSNDNVQDNRSSKSTLFYKKTVLFNSPVKLIFANNQTKCGSAVPSHMDGAYAVNEHH